LKGVSKKSIIPFGILLYNVKYLSISNYSFDFSLKLFKLLQKLSLSNLTTSNLQYALEEIQFCKLIELNGEFDEPLISSIVSKLFSKCEALILYTSISKLSAPNSICKQFELILPLIKFDPLCTFLHNFPSSIEQCVLSITYYHMRSEWWRLINPSLWKSLRKLTIEYDNCILCESIWLIKMLSYPALQNSLILLELDKNMLKNKDNLVEKNYYQNCIMKKKILTFI